MGLALGEGAANGITLPGRCPKADIGGGGWWSCTHTRTRIDTQAPVRNGHAGRAVALTSDRLQSTGGEGDGGEGGVVVVVVWWWWCGGGGGRYSYQQDELSAGRAISRTSYQQDELAISRSQDELSAGRAISKTILF